MQQSHIEQKAARANRKSKLNGDDDDNGDDGDDSDDDAISQLVDDVNYIRANRNR
jgi:hypothetical protein